MAYIQAKQPGTSGGGSGILTAVNQEYYSLLAGETEMIITSNGGIAPLSDEGILLQTATGPLFQGVALFQYTIDRVSVPNKLILNTPLLADLELQVQLIY